MRRQPLTDRLTRADVVKIQDLHKLCPEAVQGVQVALCSTHMKRRRSHGRTVLWMSVILFLP